jgi:hypothetical protein
MTPPQDSSTPLETDLPRFKSPKVMPREDPLDPTSTSTRSLPPEEELATGSSPGEGWGIGGERDELGEASASRTTTPSRVFTEQAKAFEALLGTGLGMATMVAHSKMAPEGSDVWLATDDEIEAVAAPLSRILARHTPVSSGRATDLADGIEAGVGVAGYVVVNLRRQAEIQLHLEQQGGEQPA